MQYLCQTSGAYTRWIRVNADGSADTADSNYAMGWYAPSLAAGYFHGAAPLDLATAPDWVRAILA